MTYRIFPIRKASAQQLAEIHQHCFSLGWSAQDFQIFFDNPLYDGFVIEENQFKIVGFIDLHVVVDEAEVYTLCVMNGHRRKGLGWSLLEALFIKAHQLGVQKLFLEVAEDNVSGRHLYEAFGFKKIGRRCGYYLLGDHGVTAIVYERILTDEG
ncbi:MAG: GNAT family N-acetyltransferase [Holosporales bacterium]|jgi:ribosomal-protein-alanine N-acetyltransferase|nr:GNAT family N-acetyltransferase [Holosporales bacterium]